MDPPLFGRQLCHEFEGRHVIIYPLAFTVDNSETECELAIEYAEKAQQLGLASYTVTKAPNDHPLLWQH